MNGLDPSITDYKSTANRSKTELSSDIIISVFDKSQDNLVTPQLINECAQWVRCQALIWGLINLVESWCIHVTLRNVIVLTCQVGAIPGVDMRPYQLLYWKNFIEVWRITLSNLITALLFQCSFELWLPFSNYLNVYSDVRHALLGRYQPFNICFD